MRKILSFSIIAFSLLASAQTQPEKEGEIPNTPRTIVTTDGEIDDVDSFIRMLLYACIKKWEAIPEMPK